jgi:hypothetical protein
MAINGVVFYEGPSLIDGQPIVGIATFKTSNDKTGNLVQTWILRADIHPQDAIDMGSDFSVCGNCPLRGRIAPASERTKKAENRLDTTNKDRCCYVLVQNAPSAIYKSYLDGQYPRLAEKHRKLFRGKGLRLGAYGDPVAIPVENWDELDSYVVSNKRKPGYTHQWKQIQFEIWSGRLMASTHSLSENVVAHAAGWRTFRTIADVSELSDNEIICPASEEGGSTVSCDHCGACNGRRDMSDVRRNIAIVAHGSSGKVARVVQIGRSN